MAMLSFARLVLKLLLLKNINENAGKTILMNQRLENEDSRREDEPENKLKNK